MGTRIAVIVQAFILGLTGVIGGGCKSGPAGSGVKVDPAPPQSYEDHLAEVAKEERLRKEREQFLGETYSKLSSVVLPLMRPDSPGDLAGKAAYLWDHINRTAVARGRQVTADMACASKSGKEPPKLFLRQVVFARGASDNKDTVFMNFLKYTLEEPFYSEWTPGAGRNHEWKQDQKGRYPVKMSVWNYTNSSPTTGLLLGTPDGQNLVIEAVAGKKTNDFDVVHAVCVEVPLLAALGDPRLTVDAFRN